MADLDRPDGLIFDLDGTLVDTVGARIEGWLEALAAAGLRTSREQVAPMIGMDGKRLAQKVAASGGRVLTEDEVEAIDKDAGAAFDRLNRQPQLLPGVSEVIEAAETAGIQWVIATSSRKEQVKASVAALGLRSAPTIVDGSHVKNAKPEPDLLMHASARMNIFPERCWGIGDSTWDMLAASAANMTAVGVTAGSAVDRTALRAAGASLVLPTLVELAAIIRESDRP